MTFLRRSTRQRKFLYGTFNESLVVDAPSVEQDKPDEEQKETSQQPECDVQPSLDAEVTVDSLIQMT